MVFCSNFRLALKIYIYICIYPIFSTSVFFAHEFIDLITGGSHSSVSKDDTTKLLNVALVILIIISVGILYMLHLSIQERSRIKFTLYFASLYILLFITYGMFAVKHSRAERNKVDHVAIDIARYLYFWFFTLQFTAMADFRETLRKEDEPPKIRLFGFRLENLFLIQIFMAWFAMSHAAYIWFYSPILQQELSVGLKLFFLVGVIAAGGFAVNSCVLYKGVQQESPTLIRIHYYTKIILYSVYSSTVYFADRMRRLNASSHNQPFWAQFDFLFIRWLYIFELWALVIYLHLLKRRKAYCETAVSNVYEGINWVKIDVETKRLLEEAQISDWKIKLDETHKLGEGTFAKVILGHLRVGTFSLKTIPVAVKLLKQTDQTQDDEGYTEAFVSEVKSLFMSKNHPCLIEVYGLTRCKEKPGVVMEYCSLGSLDQYIRKKANQEEILKNMQLSDGFNGQNELHRWALQIALGLEFLKKMNIIHGDLAARNVLLELNKNVKITDFGMSVRLHNYQMYAKSSTFSVFPWRWMAPESLSDLKFSIQSDIWAYGVTLWEIFSFGQTPWQTFAWTSDFINITKLGQVLDKPSHASLDLYNSIMCECWRVEEGERIEIQEIIAYLLKDRNKLKARKSRFISTDEQV